MNLNVNDWKEFKTSKLFYDMQNGKANQQMLEKGNCIIFICNGQGSVGYANYMDVDFIGTTDIVAGYNDNLNEYTGIFLATIYSQERPKYSFGRKWKTHLADTKIFLFSIMLMEHHLLMWIKSIRMMVMFQIGSSWKII